jgi:hypothetical protein
VNVGLFCETYRELIDRQVGKIQVEFPPYLGEIRDSHIAGFGFYLRPEYGGGTVEFDGELVRKDGKFVPADLQALNG